MRLFKIHNSQCIYFMSFVVLIIIVFTYFNYVNFLYKYNYKIEIEELKVNKTEKNTQHDKIENPKFKPAENPRIHLKLFEQIHDRKEKLQSDTWRPEKPAGKLGHHYSAYFDDRSQVKDDSNIFGVVRVIGIMPLSMNSQSLNCHLKYKLYTNFSYTEITVKASSVSAIRENWGLQYSPFFILCPVMKNQNADMALHPSSVRISDMDNSNSPTQFIDIHYQMNKPLKAEEIAVCVKPVYFNYSRSLQMIEFIEFYQQLGVSHFFFYNKSMTKEVSDVLDHYIQNGVATVTTWNLYGYKYEKDIRDDGIFAALNDCLYRSSFYYNYKYVINVDIDEFLIPEDQDTLNEFIEVLETKSHTNAGFIIRNVFHYLFWCDKSLTEPNLLTQNCINRTENILPAHSRSKYIIRARDVVEMGNHFLWEFIPGFGEMYVPTEMCLSHHYRACEEYEANCRKRAAVRDKTALRFGDKIVSRVKAKCEKIFHNHTCPPK